MNSQITQITPIRKKMVAANMIGGGSAAFRAVRLRLTDANSSILSRLRLEISGGIASYSFRNLPVRLSLTAWKAAKPL
ncbi:MAG TPA: hypothetical protein DC047_10565 [Blastocatellia bacterium]|nr:hypothetical protein [Blastocatellia bacterium]